MKHFFFFLYIFFPSLLFAQTYTHADSLHGGLRPERTAFDVYYYDLQVEVDIPNKSIKGTVGIYFDVVDATVHTIQIDLFKNLQVNTIVDANGNPLIYRRDENAMFIQLPATTQHQKTKMTITYEGIPIAAKRPPWDGGFIWRKDKNGHPWVAVACQGIGASLWWPCKDTQSDRADSVSIAITVPADLVAVSNGNQRSVELHGSQATYHWFVSYPINNYNISINIGNYVHFGEPYKGIETTYNLDYYVLDYNLDKAKEHFKQVVPMLDVYEKKLGPYPFPRDGYALIEVPYLGMEHQSGIAYGNRYLKGYEGVERSGIDLGFDFIIIHETGHEYWGNSVAAQDIADMWIHEGFCTYTEALYVEEMYGPDTALAYCNAWKLLVDNDIPIIGDYGVNNEGSGDMYNKGALMLHTLRWLVNNDKKWLTMLLHIQKNYRWKIVTGDELIRYMNKQLGKDYTWLFDQYLKNASPPVLHYTLEEKANDLEVTIQWTEVSSDFALPVTIRLSADKCKTYTITSQPQKILLKDMKKGDFKVDEQHAYFLIR